MTPTPTPNRNSFDAAAIAATAAEWMHSHRERIGFALIGSAILAFSWKIAAVATGIYLIADAWAEVPSKTESASPTE